MDGPPHIARQNVELEKRLLQNLIPSAVMLGDLIVFGSLEPGAWSLLCEPKQQPVSAARFTPK